MNVTLLYEHPRAGFTLDVVTKAHDSMKERLGAGEVIIVKEGGAQFDYPSSKPAPSFQVTDVWLEEQGGITRLLANLKDLGPDTATIKMECSIGVRK